MDISLKENSTQGRNNNLNVQMSGLVKSDSLFRTLVYNGVSEMMGPLVGNQLKSEVLPNSHTVRPQQSAVRSQ